MTAPSDFQKPWSRDISEKRDCAFHGGAHNHCMDHKQWIRDVVDSEDGQARGKTRAGLARVLGRSQSVVNRLLDGDQDLKVSDIAKISEYLEVEPPPFHRSRFVPLIGKVAAGKSEIVYFVGHGLAPLDFIMIPHHGAPSNFALEVEGDSMKGIAGEGFVVFIGEKHSPPTRDQIDQLCVCRLATGQRVIKFLNASRYEGKFDLYSSNDAPLLAQEVAWAAVVTNIIPRAQAARLPRQSEMLDGSEFLNFEKLA